MYPHAPTTSLNNPSELSPSSSSAIYRQYRTQAYGTRVPVQHSSAMRDEKALKMSGKTWSVSECLFTRTETCVARIEDACQKIDALVATRPSAVYYAYSRVPRISLPCEIFAQLRSVSGGVHSGVTVTPMSR